MKQNFKKKAFTLVELLVVIAIIAVLASVSVVGYMHFIDKAHDSNDITLVKQLNTVLSSSSITTKNNETMREAVEDLASSSITADQLSSEKNEILWDQDSDRFLVVKGEEILYKDEATNANIVATPHKLWKVYNEIPETQNYSIYLNQKEESVSLYAEPQVDFTLTTGFDAGNVSTAFNLTYTGLASEEPNTIFNLNSGNLTINDEKANVNVLGKAEALNVYNTSSNAINVNATLNVIRLNKGKINLADNTSIKTIWFDTITLDDNTMINIPDTVIDLIEEVKVIDKNILNNPKLSIKLKDKNMIIDIDSIFSGIYIKNNKLFIKEKYDLNNSYFYTLKIEKKHYRANSIFYFGEKFKNDEFKVETCNDGTLNQSLPLMVQSYYSGNFTIPVTVENKFGKLSTKVGIKTDRYGTYILFNEMDINVNPTTQNVLVPAASRGSIDIHINIYADSNYNQLLGTKTIRDPNNKY